ncbi:sigma-70 family RNA polymerase sigma factor [Luteipulveratus sp. YIM 133132]|uniref:sigma-70 family RNA polymerase sigma factor n=1 Tax=Luteipulveratus flavus TaxID=3031728 RepID=UPI0023AEAE64|nr:sigma-70 family RNA polymerase sigma factor [Luteipulveratus sp. YIM 133132]MDE9365648.1 sigma-70 family RNA polymerase sigma factor [Luteipulveratus sp. YIM 133132]
MSLPLPTPPPAPDDDSTAEELLEQAAAETDPAAAAALRDEVVLRHRGLARSVARRFTERGVDPDDLEQVAMVGLVQAARRYKPGVGHGFIAFAVPTMTGEIKRHFRDHGWAVRPPRSLQEAHHDVRQAGDQLTQFLQRLPTPQELAEHLGLELGVVEHAELLQDQYRSASLDAPMIGVNELTLGDSVADPHDAYIGVDAMVSLQPVLHRLTPRERLIVRMRYVDNLTQRQIGTHIGVSQMQVSRLLRGILDRLRRQVG